MEYEGAIYHVMNRGDRREAIFLGDEDRDLFLETLGEACVKTDWQPHADGLLEQRPQPHHPPSKPNPVCVKSKELHGFLSDYGLQYSIVVPLFCWPNLAFRG